MRARIFAIAKKELIQLRRDRISLAMVVMLPAMQLLLFGYAIDTDVRHLRTVAFDQDRSVASRRLIHHLEATTYYDFQGAVRNEEQIVQTFNRGIADVALVIPPDFQRNILRGMGAPVQLVVNGSDPQIVGSAVDAAQGLAGSVSDRIEVHRMDARGLRPSPDAVMIQPLIRYNPDRRTAVFIVPGLIGVILTMTMVMFTSMAVARERERGTLEALIVSPAKSFEIIAGKIAPYVMVGYLQMSIVVTTHRFKRKLL